MLKPALVLLLSFLPALADEPIALKPSHSFYRVGIHQTTYPAGLFVKLGQQAGITVKLSPPFWPQEMIEFDHVAASIEEIFDFIAQKSRTRWKAISPTEIVVPYAGTRPGCLVGYSAGRRGVVSRLCTHHAV